MDFCLCVLVLCLCMCLEVDGLYVDWCEVLWDVGEFSDFDCFIEYLLVVYLLYVVVIDCSGSVEVVECYEGWLVVGIYVVILNK